MAILETPQRPADLMTTYVERRGALLRFFTARTRSRDLAEDIVQDIAERIMAMTEAQTCEIGNPAAFLYRMGCNLMLDRMKSRTRSLARDADWSSLHVTQAGLEAVDDLPAADDAVHARQRLLQVLRTVEGLRPQCRRVFRLHKLEGLSHAEVAERLGISRSAVEKHVSFALRMLLQELP